MPSCAVKWCKNNSTSQKKSDGITFHRLPKKEERWSVWVEVLRKSRFQNTWVPSEGTLVCSKHFEDDDFYMTPNGLRRLSISAFPKKGLFPASYVDHEIIEPELTETNKRMQHTSEYLINILENDNITIKTEPAESVIIDPLPESKEQLLVYAAPFVDPNKKTKPILETPTSSSSNFRQQKPVTDKRPCFESKEPSAEIPNVRRLQEQLKKKQTQLELKDKKIKVLKQSVRRLTKRVEQLRKKMQNSHSEKYVDISIFIK